MPAEKNRCPGETYRRVAVLASRPVAGALSYYPRQNADALLLRRSISIFSRVVTKVE